MPPPSNEGMAVFIDNGFSHWGGNADDIKETFANINANKTETN